jgi:hypothetical protein
MNCNEVITWVKVEDRLPDDESTVLMFVPHASEPVWLEGTDWFAADGAPIEQGKVVAWANMPGGPR